MDMPRCKVAFFNFHRHLFYAKSYGFFRDKMTIARLTQQ